MSSVSSKRGHYGDVSIVDLDGILALDEELFYGFQSYEASLVHPLMLARLGAQAQEYIMKLSTINEEADTSDIANPKLFKLQQPRAHYVAGGFEDVPRRYEQLDADRGALAHLLTIENLMTTGHHQPRHEALAHDLGCHSWRDPVRFVGVRTETVTDIEDE